MLNKQAMFLDAKIVVMFFLRTTSMVRMIVVHTLLIRLVGLIQMTLITKSNLNVQNAV
jgi:hypothetical protein